MAATNPSAEVPDAGLDELVEAGIYSSAQAGFEHGLVVLAMGLSYCLLPADGGYRLMVDPGALERVREQLAIFDRESVDWPPAPLRVERRPVDLLTPLAWAILVLASFRLQTAWPAWSEEGAVDTGAIFRRGEFWRPLTALFLHADAGHLASNLPTGILAFSAVLSTMGRLRGWSLIMLAAVLGNIAAAAAYFPEPYRSLGASTAIFAALGLLTGRASWVARHAARGLRRRPLFLPVATGATVLGLYGAGGVQVDVLAHATGFLAGLVLGFVAAAGTPCSPAPLPTA